LEQRTRALLVEFQVVVAWSVTSQFRPRDVFNAGERPALARIWVDARAPTRAVLYLVDDAHERFLVRVVPLDGGYDEVACESIGTIVQSSVEALLAGASVGVTREAAEEQVAAIEPESAPPPPPQPPVRSAPAPLVAPPSPTPDRRRTRSSLTLGIDAGYRAALLHAAPVILHGPELGLRLARGGRGLSVAGQLQAGYRLPLRWEVSHVGAKFQGGGARLAGGLRAGLTSAFSLTVLGSVGAELLRVEPSVSEGSERPREAFNVLQPMVGAGLESELELGRHFAGWLMVGAESDLLGHRFDVLRDGVSEPLLDPWPIQGVVRIGARLRP
jgi:hypothetical protein